MIIPILILICREQERQGVLPQSVMDAKAKAAAEIRSLAPSKVSFVVFVCIVNRRGGATARSASSVRILMTVDLFLITVAKLGDFKKKTHSISG